MQSIEFDPDELDVAAQWHGGQASMMYAVASTGALRRGVERCRPRVDCDACGGRGWLRGARMTDAQWLAYLAGKLASEASECAEDARKRCDEDQPGEMAEHAMVLDGIAAKCLEAIERLGGA